MAIPSGEAGFLSRRYGEYSGWSELAGISEGVEPRSGGGDEKNCSALLNTERPGVLSSA